jgi:hypothetical protein
LLQHLLFFPSVPPPSSRLSCAVSSSSMSCTASASSTSCTTSASTSSTLTSRACTARPRRSCGSLLAQRRPLRRGTALCDGHRSSVTMPARRSGSRLAWCSRPSGSRHGWCRHSLDLGDGTARRRHGNGYLTTSASPAASAWTMTNDGVDQWQPEELGFGSLGFRFGLRSFCFYF